MTTPVSESRTHREQMLARVSRETAPGPAPVERAESVASPPGPRDTDRQQHYEEIARQVNSYLESSKTELKVEIHRESHTPIFRIIRQEDNEVIREVPPREMLEIAANVRRMAGMLLSVDA